MAARKVKAMPVTKANFLAVAQAAWARALSMTSFGYAEISQAVGISMEQATKIVRGWQREGAVWQVQAPSGGTRAMWRCNPDFVRIEPLRQRTPEENMWTTMRRIGAFTPTDLAVHSTTETVSVDPQQAGEYCRALLDAGFLTVARRAAPAMKREAIYRLVEVTGVNAPVLKRVRAVYDPNTGRAHVISQLSGGME